MVLFSVVMWQNWYMRNQLVHGKGRVEVDSVVSWCRGYISNYKTTNQSQEMVDSGDMVPQLILWKLSMGGMYKLNTDAALDVRLLRVSLGMDFYAKDYESMIDAEQGTPRAQGSSVTSFVTPQNPINPLTDRNRQMRILIAMALVTAHELNP
ncbi:hypothetical protein Dsin_000977 [Dipteronia sinensis]|uniref:Uncharacterized protein n=1 Tax=Dipteronia sinensis TaxID=43782 RepID=A0AAE0B3H5_9ROSI|nr:hypothetical protein Dsin_000977 [Dipteronia sinensis]